MNARDAIASTLQRLRILWGTQQLPESIVHDLRASLGWDGTGTPPDIVITGDGQLKRLEPEWVCLGGAYPGEEVRVLRYLLVDPEGGEDTTA